MPSQFTLSRTSKLLCHPTQIETLTRTRAQIVGSEFPYELVTNNDNSVKCQKGREFMGFSVVSTVDVAHRREGYRIALDEVY